jgi:hypothetical protein
MGRTHPNLVGHWRAENNPNDTSGNGNLSSWFGSEGYAKGKYGNAFDFKRVGTLSSNPCVRTGLASNSLNPPFSVAAWIRPTAYSNSSAGAYRIFSRGDGGASRGFVALDGEKLTLSVTTVGNLDYQSAAGVTPLNQWSHVVAVWRSGGGDIYLNGVFLGSGAGTLADAAATTAVIGAATDVSALFLRGFDGQIDDVQIWNRALQPHHIRAIYDGVDPAFIGDVA